MNIDTLFSLYHSGAYLCLVLVALYLGLRYASQHFAWLEAPNRAHYVAALLTGLAAVAVPASQGTTPNASMLTAAAFSMLALLMPGLAKVA